MTLGKLVNLDRNLHLLDGLPSLDVSACLPACPSSCPCRQGKKLDYGSISALMYTLTRWGPG